MRKVHKSSPPIVEGLTPRTCPRQIPQLPNPPGYSYSREMRRSIRHWRTDGPPNGKHLYCLTNDSSIAATERAHISIVDRVLAVVILGLRRLHVQGTQMYFRLVI